MFFIDFEEKLHPLCILQYTYPHDSKIKGQPHKNSKGNASFNRSKTNVLTKIKDQANNVSTPTKVYDKVFSDSGGILEANSCGSLPRNKNKWPT